MREEQAIDMAREIRTRLNFGWGNTEIAIAADRISRVSPDVTWDEMDQAIDAVIRSERVPSLERILMCIRNERHHRREYTFESPTRQGMTEEAKRTLSQLRLRLGWRSRNGLGSENGPGYSSKGTGKRDAEDQAG